MISEEIINFNQEKYEVLNYKNEKLIKSMPKIP